MRHGGRPASQRLAACLCLLLLLPAGGCGERGERVRDDVADAAGDTWRVVRDEVAGAWDCVQTTTADGMVVLGRLAEDGAGAASETARAVFVWSQDTAGDGWAWIRARSEDAATWAEDTASGLWMVTKDGASHAYLWVRTEAQGGLAWLRVAIPDAWRLTRDAAGDVWVWIGERNLTAVAVAAIARIIVFELLTLPLASVRTLARIGAVGASAVGGQFLASLYEKHAPDLPSVSLDDFLGIGASLVPDLAAEVGGFRQAVVGRE